MAAAKTSALDNQAIAAQLERVADLLEEQRANQYRVQAWRNGAATIRGLDRPAAELLESEGIEGLDRLPGIGASLARAVRELVDTGSLATLERLQGQADPISVLASVPGVGDALAARAHTALAIGTLEELEAAAHDGRLAKVPGFGAKRIAGIRDALASRLSARRRARKPFVPWPAVSELLDVDREYREKADAKQLPTIAPRRFNPEGESWLPVLHTNRDDRHYTALYSNTALAHRLHRTHDWVVLYYDGEDGEHQVTVVTEARGALAGRRVVRGREAECKAHYELHEEEAPSPTPAGARSG